MLLEKDDKNKILRFLPTIKIKDYHVIIDGKNFFDQLVKNDLITYDNIWKVTTSQGDDYTAGCLLDYSYVKNVYNIIAIDLTKQQALVADPKGIQKINFTGNLTQDENATICFIIEEAKETVLDFSN